MTKFTLHCVSHKDLCVSKRENRIDGPCGSLGSSRVQKGNHYFIMKALFVAPLLHSRHGIYSRLYLGI